MPGLDVALTFFLAAVLLALAPGPDNIFVLTQSALYGARAGIYTTLGLLTGAFLQTLAVALGIAAIFKASPLAFNLLRIFGAGYLCWLAWLSFRAQASTTGVAASFPGYGPLYRRGVLMNISNPKVILFFLAFLPQFCDPAIGSVGLQIVFFGILFILASLIVFFAVALLGGKIAAWFNNSPKGQIIMHRIAGLVFLGLALALVFMEQ